MSARLACRASALTRLTVAVRAPVPPCSAGCDSSVAASVASVVALTTSIESTAALSAAVAAILTVAVPTATVLSFIPVALVLWSSSSLRSSCPS